MRLAAFSVQRYRSITRAHKLRLGDMTILVGPNNEGKSNILRAMVVGMRLLSRAGRVRLTRGRLRTSARDFSQDYEWSRDFPLALQAATEARTILDFDFALNEPELAEFHVLTGSWLNALLPIRLLVGREDVEVRILKRGPASPRLNELRDSIAEFIGRRINLEYVRAVRPAEEAERVVREMILRELAVVEETEAYQAAIRQIEALQKPVFDHIAETIRVSLAEFLGDIRGVTVELPSDRTSGPLRFPSVIIDDGTPTDLNLKGDGVQSLAAISLIRHVSKEIAKGRELVLAIEEPESHLHPSAIHRMKRVLDEIAATQQVIITTHSPLLISRTRLDQNIIVAHNEAVPARTIQELRSALGVRIADNLAAADTVLVVEGDSDKLALIALLSSASIRLQRALDTGALAVEVGGGASGILPKLFHLRDALCQYHVFVDNDEAGAELLDRANRAGILQPADQTAAAVPGMRQSELEDLYDPAIYSEYIRTTYNVTLGGPQFRNAATKWSGRVERSFHDNGQVWDEHIARILKSQLARLVQQAPLAALRSERRSSFDALLDALERKVAVM